MRLRASHQGSVARSYVEMQKAAQWRLQTKMAQYQNFIKYRLFSSGLQYIARNLSPFVVNVIVKLNKVQRYPAL